MEINNVIVQGSGLLGVCGRGKELNGWAEFCGLLGVCGRGKELNGWAGFCVWRAASLGNFDRVGEGTAFW